MPNTELATTEIIEINPPNPTNNTPQERNALQDREALEILDKRFLCRHIFTDGRRCGSPALKEQNFCYYHYAYRTPILAHQRRRRRASGFDLTNFDGLDNPTAVQLSLTEVLARIAANTIDPKRAGLLIYGLQVASNNLRRADLSGTARVPDNIIEDPTYGQIASLEPGRTEPETYISRMISGKYPPEDPPEDSI
jgi:hypothetical protein